MVNVRGVPAGAVISAASISNSFKEMSNDVSAAAGASAGSEVAAVGTAALPLYASVMVTIRKKAREAAMAAQSRAAPVAEVMIVRVLGKGPMAAPTIGTVERQRRRMATPRAGAH